MDKYNLIFSFSDLCLFSRIFDAVNIDLLEDDDLFKFEKLVTAFDCIINTSFSFDDINYK